MRVKPPEPFRNDVKRKKERKTAAGVVKKGPFRSGFRTENRKRGLNSETTTKRNQKKKQSSLSGMFAGFHLSGTISIEKKPKQVCTAYLKWGMN